MADGPAYAYITDGAKTTGDSRVSAVLVETTPERSDRILSSVSDSVMVMAEEFQPDDRTRSESGLLREEGGVLHVCTDIAGGGGAVAAAVTSPVVFAEDFTEGVMLSTVAGGGVPGRLR